METIDSLKPADRVTVTIFGPDGDTLFESTGTGYHSLESAINSSLAAANLNINPKECVFDVTNHKTEVSHRYRLNAHGNLKLIV